MVESNLSVKGTRRFEKIFVSGYELKLAGSQPAGNLFRVFFYSTIKMANFRSSKIPRRFEQVDLKSLQVTKKTNLRLGSL